jgi:predicted nucleotidyltransferase
MIAGFPATEVRWLMRRMRPYQGVTSKFIANVLKIEGEDQTQAVVSALTSLGYIERIDLKDDRIWFTPTDLGVSLSLASAAKRITRKTAERSIAEFMKRVHWLNHNRKYLFKVTAVVVYGSYLTSTESLGDVDIAVELTWREPDQKKYHELIWAHISAARRKGRHFANLTDEVVWPQTEVLLYLRNRKRSLSIHTIADLKELAREKPLRYRVLLGDRQAIAAQLGPLATEV